MIKQKISKDEYMDSPLQIVIKKKLLFPELKKNYVGFEPYFNPVPNIGDQK